ncbi:ZZ-type zinc finger-containing protein 3 [Drosophila albomicans]|uniref:ZZ-type zinc finger-containing protein 3 n=1 Tax=Drosophila albomicans TaxID=7291 RepID=A0A6P8WDW3_DROAB|nr:ZZ-type zinc finger-containing protein 3 [Drosophila albomicans]
MEQNHNKPNNTEPDSLQDECEDDDEIEDEDDVFHFESEHLALRGNQSYTNLLRTIALLQAQRIRVHQQIDELEKARDLYLAQPQLLMQKLRNNEPIIAPNYITTVSLPELPSLSVGEDVKKVTAPKASQESDKNTLNKAPTRLWTNEEQRRLEQLLIDYPPEEVEMRRFGKIAKELGNRTAQQVFSRVQKYFQKLHDAGLPVPGRLPKYRRAGGGLSTRKFNIRRSTFFPAQNIEIHMPEDDYAFDELRPVTASPTLKVEPKLELGAQGKKQLQLKMLTAIREEKLLSEDGYSPDPLAPRCAECEESAVTRDRWHCNSCYCFINLCGDCLADQLVNETFEHITHDVVVEQET